MILVIQWLGAKLPERQMLAKREDRDLRKLTCQNQPPEAECLLADIVHITESSERDHIQRTHMNGIPLHVHLIDAVMNHDE